jgi:hypothetical protein
MKSAKLWMQTGKPDVQNDLAQFLSLLFLLQKKLVCEKNKKIRILKITRPDPDKTEDCDVAC